MIFNQPQQEIHNSLDDELIMHLQKQLQHGRQARQPPNRTNLPSDTGATEQLNNVFNLPPEHTGNFFQGLMPIQESNLNVNGALTHSKSPQGSLPKCYSADSVASNTSLMSYESTAIAREYENFLLNMANNINNTGGGASANSNHFFSSVVPAALNDHSIFVSGTNGCDHRASSLSATPSLAYSSTTTISQLPQLLESSGSSSGSSDDKDAKVELYPYGNGEMITTLKTSNSKVNVDPIKRSKSDPGTTLDDIINSGIDPNKLHPQVLRRIKNTDAARRSRMKKQTKMREMEGVLGGQRNEISKLREVTELLREELKTLRCESEGIKINYYRLRSFLASKGIRIPAELELDLR